MGMSDSGLILGSIALGTGGEGISKSVGGAPIANIGNLGGGLAPSGMSEGCG